MIYHSNNKVKLKQAKRLLKILCYHSNNALYLSFPFTHRITTPQTVIIMIVSNSISIYFVEKYFMQWNERVNLVRIQPCWRVWAWDHHHFDLEYLFFKSWLPFVDWFKKKLNVCSVAGYIFWHSLHWCWWFHTSDSDQLVSGLKLMGT